MPNWVYNNVTITGPKETLDNIAATVAERERADGTRVDPISFQTLIPRPADQEDNWYEWNIANWGTKWDAARPEVERPDDTTLTYSFETAWAPPGPIFEALSQRWPDTIVTIDYEEETGWGGRIRTEHGQFIEHVNWDAPESHLDQIKIHGQCHCGDEHQVHPDCWVERAKAANLPPTAIEIIRALSEEWQGTYNDLVEASQKI